jgi:glycerol kinase
MQSQTDLLGVPVEVYPHPCATALGVAAFALRGRFGAGAEDAVVRGWQPSAVYEPRWSDEQRRERYGRWAAALEATLAPDLRADGAAP